MNGWTRWILSIGVLAGCAAFGQAAPAPAQPNIEALRMAIQDLSHTFGERYPHGAEYLARLDALAPEGEERAEALRAIEREALLANPLLDFDKILLVKRGEGNLGLPQNWDSNSTLSPRGYDNELCLLTPVRPDGAFQTLYRPANGEFIGDVELHFDGGRLLFSMPNDAGRWRVYESEAAIGAAPKALALIDEADVDNYDACYLANDDVLFTSTAPFVGVPCVTGSSHVANLYRWYHESGTIRRLTFDQDHDWCPTLLPNGRVLYLRWEYSDLPHFVSRILFHMNPDGTEQMEYYGSNSYWPNAMFYARALPGRPTAFAAIVGGHHDLPRMGELVLFDTALGRREAQGVIQRIPGHGKKVESVLLDGLTRDSWPKFLHPYPLSEKYILVSAKPTPESKWGLYLADVFDNLTLIKELDGYALLEPTPLRATPRPPVIPDKVGDVARASQGAAGGEAPQAYIQLADIYAGGGLDGVPRGTVKALRLFTYHFAYHGMGGQINRVGLDGPWDVKRIIGTVPVEEDGSAYFRAPANTPISVQPLDGEGQALQLMRSWMVAMPGETLSCVGCHESQNSAPRGARPVAARRAPSAITPWYGPARGFSFDREVQPVLDAYCVKCHNGAASAGAVRPDFRLAPCVHPDGPDNAYRQGSLFPPAYLALRRFVRSPTIESDMHLLTAGEYRADTAELVQMLRKGHHGVRLDPEAWDRLITWIDLATPAHGTWHEIVGDEKVNHQRDRRRAMLESHAGIDEDPEAILATVHTSLGQGASPEQEAPEATAAPEAGSTPAAQQQATLARRQLDLGEGVTLDLVLIPAGRFTMGDPNGEADERPCTAIEIPHPFWMGSCEITNAQFARFDPRHDSRLEDGDYLQFSVEERGYPVNRPNQPVARVSWHEAMAFCAWLSARVGDAFTLPSEAQWEYACRAGTSTALWYGAPTTAFAPFANLADATFRRVDTFAPWELPSGAIAPWRPAAEDVDDGHRVASEVGGFAPNPWGLYDIHGNVWEWTSSLDRPYPYSAQDGREEPTAASARVVRGGSWYDRPHRARSAFRLSYDPWRRVFNVGFRVICPAD